MSNTDCKIKVPPKSCSFSICVDYEYCYKKKRLIQQRNKVKLIKCTEEDKVYHNYNYKWVNSGINGEEYEGVLPRVNSVKQAKEDVLLVYGKDSHWDLRVNWK